MSKSHWLEASGAAIWALVNHYTGRVGYKGGIKAMGLDADPPVIDCSGWAAFLLSTGMEAANGAVAAELFRSDDIAAFGGGIMGQARSPPTSPPPFANSRLRSLSAAYRPMQRSAYDREVVLGLRTTHVLGGSRTSSKS